MPKILITGNGFDLSLGLPTSYSDFINIINSLEGDITFSSIYSKTSLYTEITKRYNVFDFDLDKIEKLKEACNKNSWLEFFKTEFEIETWIDFENRIEYVLNMLFSSVKYLKENLFSSGPLGSSNELYNTKLFNHNIEVIQVLHKFNVILLDDDLNIQLNIDYLLTKYGLFTDLDISKVTRSLIEELDNFKEVFNLYFEIFVFPLYDNQKSRIDTSLFGSIQRHYTFNYTPTFERIYRQKNKTSFLHGKINSSNNQLVLGINEIPKSDLDKRHFLPFTKYFQKLDNSTDFHFLVDYEKRKSSNYTFFFYGHSLDSSDKDYINEVFDFINTLSGKMKKIVIIYHTEKSKSQQLINLLNIRGKDDIQHLMRNGILVFYNITSNELTRELRRDLSAGGSRVSVL